MNNFLDTFDARSKLLIEKNTVMLLEFKQEMLRFLSKKESEPMLEVEELWDFITYLIEELGNQIRYYIHSIIK